MHQNACFSVCKHYEPKILATSAERRPSALLLPCLLCTSCSSGQCSLHSDLGCRTLTVAPHCQLSPRPCSSTYRCIYSSKYFISSCERNESREDGKFGKVGRWVNGMPEKSPSLRQSHPPSSQHRPALLRSAQHGQWNPRNRRNRRNPVSWD